MTATDDGAPLPPAPAPGPVPVPVPELWLLRMQRRLGWSPLRFGITVALLLGALPVLNVALAAPLTGLSGRRLFETLVIGLVNATAIGYAVAFQLHVLERTRADLRALGPLCREPADVLAAPMFAPLAPATRAASIGLALAVWTLLNVINIASGRAAGSPLDMLWGPPLFLCLWLILWYAVFVMVRAANVLARIGSMHIQVDVLATHRLTAFMTIGMRVMLISIGGLSLMLVQYALIGTSSMADWLPAMLIVVPMAFFLLLRPMWGVHVAIVRARDAELARVDAELGYQPERPLDDIGSARFAALCAYRERLLAVHEWPISRSGLWRVALYLVIPPLAWTAAALLEVLVDRAL